VSAALGGAKASGTARTGRALTLTLKPRRTLRAGARVTVSLRLPGEARRALKVRL